MHTWKRPLFDGIRFSARSPCYQVKRDHGSPAQMRQPAPLAAASATRHAHLLPLQGSAAAAMLTLLFAVQTL
jgi:hypothetical protein